MSIEGKSHILIVDDNLKNLQVTGRLLREEGYKISLAENGNDAINLLASFTPDLILLDVMMPEKNGYEVCREIKMNKKHKAIPIIFLTAKNQTEDLVEGFSSGGVDYITKPFNREELLIRVQTHLELSASRKKIVEMNQTRDKLYSIIAHDIRSPFASITQAIHAISNGYLKPGTAEFDQIFGLLEQRTLETTNLLNNLLEWTKFHNERININLQPTNVYSLLKECLQLLNGSIVQKNLSIQMQVSPKVVAVCDEVTIHTVFRNIISNAIKFSPENGFIEIDAEERGNDINIRFIDHGVGMTSEILHKIFHNNEPHSTKGTNNEAGSGLGLYLVKEFVEQNGGKLLVESEENTGTTFTIILPSYVNDVS